MVKRTSYDARLEADGLRALAAAGAPVPAVHSVDEHQLVMDWVSGPPAWVELGRSLATVHTTTADRFGYPIDNVIGSLPQINTWTDDWAEFFVVNRIRPHLEALPPDLAARLERACDRHLPAFLAHGASPSLVHGDLWAGNVVDGRWLIDPAVHYADREHELAFMALFGGIPEAMERAYLELLPLDDGWQRRRPILQLPHLLVHVRLFGGGYAGMVADRLDREGW